MLPAYSLSGSVLRGARRLRDRRRCRALTPSAFTRSVDPRSSRALRAYEFNVAPGVHVRHGLLDHRLALVLGFRSAIGSGTERVSDKLGWGYFLSYSVAIGDADAVFRVTPELGIGDATIPLRNRATGERSELVYWWFAALAPEFRMSALLQTSVVLRVYLGEADAAISVGPRVLFVF